ncbi:AMP-dependent synthetase/ligase [Streptomyces sp. NPDC008343]|uniref:AMP-dependent synthetase/ligase n=1 Tax=Streptomyces sp. NPDC008343 TaxID=3364828 RepID=UPI0036E81BAA
MARYQHAENLLQAFLRTARAQLNDVAIRCGWDPRFGAVSWAEYERAVAQMAHRLLRLGVTAGDRVLLSLPNCAVFHLVDTAVVAAGSVPVSVYPTASTEQTIHLLRNSEAHVVVVRPEHRARFEAAARALGRELTIVEAGPSAGPGALETWLAPHAERLDLEAAAARLKGSSIATVIYTSGTTGAAKGVVLTHANAISAFEVTKHIVGDNGRGTRVVSYLPMAHVAERMSSHYNHLLYGSEVHCCPEPGDVYDVVARVKPHIFFGPPRIWEKALLALDPRERDGDALVAGLRRLGFGEVRVAVTGAAPMPAELFNRLRQAGLPLSEVYGLSETTGVLTWDHAVPREGTVGRALPSVEVRLDDDGEIQARGPVIFAGYSGDPAATAAAFTADGWFRTGDLGEVDADGYFKVIGRSKELIVTAGGKNVAPLALEGRLSRLPGVSQAMLVGDGRPYIGALIVLEPTAGIEQVNALAHAIAQVNTSVSRAEGVRRFLVFRNEWTSDDGLLTPTSKLRRTAIIERFREEIDALYDGRQGAEVPMT